MLQTISPFYDSNICSLFYCFLSPTDWNNLSQASKYTNTAFKTFLNIVYGDMNTWKSKCPMIIHKWKCRHAINGPFNIIKPTKPLYYSHEKDSTLSIFCRPKIKII